MPAAGDAQALKVVYKVSRMVTSMCNSEVRACCFTDNPCIVSNKLCKNGVRHGFAGNIMFALLVLRLMHRQAA